MGNGVSNLTKEQKETVTRHMKDVIDTCNAAGLAQDIAQAKIMKEYRTIVQDVNNSPSPVASLQSKSYEEGSHASDKLQRTSRKVVAVTKFEPPQQRTRRPSMGGFGGYQSTSQAKKPNRRRSFDTSNTKSDSKNLEALVSSIRVNVEKAAELLAEKGTDPATAAKTIAEAAPSQQTQDNWDSVTQQPFCTLCQMAFKSAGFLERHVNYSDLHARNAKKREAAVAAASITTEQKEAAAAAAAAKEAQEKAEAEAAAAKEREKLSLRQEEGKEYKLFYNGSKFYWRTQKTVDIDMYLHILPQIIEVVAFDPDKHKEVSRIYLNYIVIAETLESVILSDIEMKRQEMSQDRFSAALSIEEELELRDTFTKNRCITYIMQRLQLDTMNEFGAVLFVPLAGDASDASPLVENPPSVLLPVFMTRRRRTNAEEIQKTLNSISTDQLLIKESNQRANSLSDNKALLEAARKKAQRIATHVHEGARFLQQKRWYADLPLPRRRFIRAVYYIMRRTQVAKVRALLMEKHPNLAFSAKYKQHLARSQLSEAD